MGFAIALICNLGLYLAISFAWVGEALNPPKLKKKSAQKIVRKRKGK